MKIKIEKNHLNWIVLVLLAVAVILVFVYRQPIGNKLSDLVSRNRASLIEIEDMEEENLEGETEEVIEETEGLISLPGQEDIYQEIAETGEGITHLARKALNHYLDDYGQNTSLLSDAHRTYIEDYLQNEIGSDWLQQGEKVSFGKDLIGQGIEKALALEDAELENIDSFQAPPTFVE